MSEQQQGQGSVHEAQTSSGSSQPLEAGSARALHGGSAEKADTSASLAHTPGPWRYISRNIDEKVNWASRIPFAIEFVLLRGSCVAPIADVVANPLVEVCDQPQAEANARLIAAAPELLAALQMVARQSGTGIREVATWDVVRAAIAKATGGGA